MGGVMVPAREPSFRVHDLPTYTTASLHRYGIERCTIVDRPRPRGDELSSIRCQMEAAQCMPKCHDIRGSVARVSGGPHALHMAIDDRVRNGNRSSLAVAMGAHHVDAHWIPTRW